MIIPSRFRLLAMAALIDQGVERDKALLVADTVADLLQQGKDDLAYACAKDNATHPDAIITVLRGGLP